MDESFFDKNWIKYGITKIKHNSHNGIDGYHIPNIKGRVDFILKEIKNKIEPDKLCSINLGIPYKPK
jgi:hypothetical protein